MNEKRVLRIVSKQIHQLYLIGYRIIRDKAALGFVFTITGRFLNFCF